MGVQAEITRLLLDAAGGDKTAVDQLLPRVYSELRRLAQHQLGQERSDHTLNATALVHEAYLRLIDQRRSDWQNRAHFMAVAAQAMRRILIDYARSRAAEKRGGNQAVVTFDEELHSRSAKAEELITLDAALERLEKHNTRQRQVVELQFFGGLKHEEIAEVLKISLPSVRRDWRLARAWLSVELSETDERGASDSLS